MNNQENASIITGQYAEATLHLSENDAVAIDQHALAQIQAICDNPIHEGSSIHIMPDVHADKVGPIGLTMTIGDAVMPQLVGNDIGCGVTSVRVNTKGGLNFDKLDKEVAKICSPNIRDRREPLQEAEQIQLSELACYPHIREDKALMSLGSLGGGNHFCEIGGNGNKDIWLTIHSGSRNLGQQVYEHYMREGQRELKSRGINLPYESTFIDGDMLSDYLHDVAITSEFAHLNRITMLRRICKAMKWKIQEEIDCRHNYIDEDGMLRKGAISARDGEKVLIPINMRDGIIIGTGKGNENWNSSAPHGSGRIAKREDITNSHTLSEYKASMKGIYSSCINQKTLDEAPFSYRQIDDIMTVVSETIEIDEIIKPLYSYKNA